MAISVNKVYRAVLSILNKEGRGFLTPEQFNRIGRQVQLDLLERSFYDYNRSMNNMSPTSSSDYSNLPKNIKEKIDVFSKEATLTLSNGIATLTSPNPTDIYRIVNIHTSNRTINVQEVTKSELAQINASDLTTPSTSFPVYYKEANSIKFFPTSVSSASVDYIKQPADPVWAYTSGTNSSYSFNSGSSQDFELHESDEVDLVLKILAYAGVLIKDPAIVQAVSAEESKIIQLENS